VIRLGFIRPSAFVDFIDTSEFDIEILSTLWAGFFLKIFKILSGSEPPFESLDVRGFKIDDFALLATFYN